jgi:hypothetical protein
LAWLRLVLGWSASERVLSSKGRNFLNPTVGSGRDFTWNLLTRCPTLGYIDQVNRSSGRQCNTGQ